MSSFAGIKALGLIALAAIVLAVAVFISGDSHPANATTSGAVSGLSNCPVAFNTSSETYDSSPPSFGGTCEYSPSTIADVATKFELAVPNVNFTSQIAFFPTAYDIKPGTDATVGAVMGRLLSAPRLGLLSGPCSTPFATGVNFTLLNSSLDASSGNLVPARPAGQSNRLLPMSNDDPAATHSGNITNIPDGVDGYPDFVAAFSDPDFINSGPDGEFGTADDIDGPLPPIAPYARYAGTTDVVGVTIVLQFLVFEPGALTAFDAWDDYAISQGVTPTNPHPFEQFDSSYGWPSVTFLATSNPFDIKASPSSITDFCSSLGVGINLLGASADNACTGSPDPLGTGDCPLKANCDGSPIEEGVCPEIPKLPSSLGGTFAGGSSPDEGGTTRLVTPAANTGILGTNTHLYGVYLASQRDADDDGIENALDPCDLSADSGWDPRFIGVQSQDVDGNGIPNSCDAAGAPGSDRDSDGFTNRQDNCPVDDNGSVATVEGQTEAATSTSITDTSPLATPYTPSALIGEILNMDSGPAIGQSRTITANTGDTITVSPAFSPAPTTGGGDNYQVFKTTAFNSDAEVFLGWPADGGPRGDAIGDVCDPDDVTSDGHYHVYMGTSAVCIDDGTGDPGGAGDSTPTTNPAPIFTGDPRSTWCTDTLDALGASSGAPEHLGLHYSLPLQEGTGLADTPYTQPCNDGIDTDGDDGANYDTSVGTGEGDGGDAGSEPDCDGTGDLDGDGFSDAVELAIGTDPRYRCSQPGHTFGDVNLAGLQDAWPPDTWPNTIRLVDGQDLVAFLSVLFKSAGSDGYNIRLDIKNPGAVIDGQDMVALLPVLFTSCTPYAGP